jgi:hypothetical protein
MKHETTRQIMLDLAADFDRRARLALDCQLLTEKKVDQQEADLRMRSEVAHMLMKL